MLAGVSELMILNDSKGGIIMKQVYMSGSSGAVYGLGFIGALVYFISTATGFWMGVLGVLKALVWPAMLVFYALKALGV